MVNYFLVYLGVVGEREKNVFNSYNCVHKERRYLLLEIVALVAGFLGGEIYI